MKSMPEKTERLYYDNAYLRTFDAQVLSVREDGWAALDRSAFYPTSGGQPYDTGTLKTEKITARVTDVQVEDGVVWHKTEPVLAPGDAVHGEIDWPRRLDHMQQHAADHMLAGAAWQLYGAVTIGLHVGHDVSSIDLTMPEGRTHLTREEADALEDLVNRRVQQDDPIRCWFPGPEELASLPLRKQPTVKEHVRVVAMGDYEMVACGGTHPGTTGQIGPVKILSCAPARGKMRLTFVAGMRAVAYLRRAARCADEMAAAVSADYETALEALRRERENAAAQRKDIGRRLTLAALQAVRTQQTGHVFAAHLDFADPDTLLLVAGEIIRDPEAVVLLSCPRKEQRMLVFARGSAAGTDMARLLKASGARGGGKPDMAQGSAPDGAALKEALRLLSTADGCV